MNDWKKAGLCLVVAFVVFLIAITLIDWQKEISRPSIRNMTANPPYTKAVSGDE